MVDCLLTGGHVADGLGNPLVRATVAIRGGRVLLLGEAERPEAAQQIDVSGKVVAPGFIDIHSHNDLNAITGVDLHDKISQGVTTEVVGNCGSSPFPITERNRPLLGELLNVVSPAPWKPSWTSWEGYARAVEQAGVHANIIGQVGHSVLRAAVMGMALRKPTPDELSEMQDLLRKCMDEGASGLSFGLMYHPGSYAEPEELLALARVVAELEGFVSVHLRAYDAQNLLAGIHEMVVVAERSGVRLQLSHLAPTGRTAQRMTDAMLASVQSARNRGVDVEFDRYPYEHALSRVSLPFPKWALADGPDALAARLADPAAVARMIPEIDAFMADIGYDQTVIVGSADPRLDARTIAEIADKREVSGAEAMVGIVGELGSAAKITLRLTTMAAQEAILSHPLCSVGSDGLACCGGTHPRTFGTFPRVLGPFVRRGVMSLPSAIHKMTGKPAKRLGLKDRGVLVDGSVADITVFDPETVSDNGTFEDPYRRSSGISAVFVAGHKVMSDGVVSEKRPGRLIRAIVERSISTTSK